MNNEKESQVIIKLKLEKYDTMYHKDNFTTRQAHVALWLNIINSFNRIRWCVFIFFILSKLFPVFKPNLWVRPDLVLF